MKIGVRGVVKYVLLLALAAALLYFAFRNLDWNDFLTNLKSCNFGWITAMIALCWLIAIVRGLRWRLLLLPVDGGVSRRETVDAYNICYLANLALPRSGEVVRCGLLAARGRGSFESILGTVVLERSWDLVCLFLMAVPLLFAGRFKEWVEVNIFDPIAAKFGWKALLIVLGTVAICVAIYLIYRSSLKNTRAGQWFSKLVRGLVDGLKAGFRMERKWRFFACTALIWVGYLFTSYFTILAFPSLSHLNLADALFLMIVGSLGWVVPVPGGFGVYHSLLAATIVIFYGFQQSQGLLLATVSHESQVLQMLLAGLISLVSAAIYKRKKI